MATQTGSIDLRGANSAKLYVDDEAGEIRSEVSETYATKTEVRRTDTGSGTVITSDDAANLPPLSITIHGKSVQDGTPMPSAPVPIQSVESRNLLVQPYANSSKTQNGVTFTVNADYSLTIRGTATAATYFNFANHTSTNPYEIEAGTYTLGLGVALPTGVSVTMNRRVGSSNLESYTINAGSSSGTRTFTASGILRCYATVASGATVDTTIYPMLESGSTAHDYQPYGYITLVTGSTTTPIDLQGNALRSLPDGTQDVLEVDGEGNVTLTQRIGLTTTATTDGITATVGTDAMSTTGTLADGATVIYKLATTQTISLGKIDLPSLPSPSFSAHVDAAVTPTLDAEWWTQGGEEVGSVYQRTSALEQDVDGITLELSEKVDSSEEWVSWLHAGTDATTHEPYLAMGKDSDYPSVVYSTDAARFYDGEGDDESNVVASFGTEGVVVGKDGSANTTISDSEIVFHDANGNEAGKISMSSAGAVPASASHTITAGDAQQTYTLEGLTPLPDFTLGYLVVNLFYNGTLNNRYRYTSIAEAEFTVSIDTYNDATFTAAQSGDTWGATMTAQHRVVGETADFTFSLEWVYLGTAPIYEFGTTENTGAYSFSAGTGLVAAGQSQAVFGKYNKPSETDLFILGNGTSDGNRSNALKVDSQGTLETSGYFQSGGVVGLGTEAQQGWLTALGPFMRFAEVTTATQSISPGSVGYFSVAAPTYTGYTLRGAIQSWASGSGTVIIGASYRSSADNNMHFVVRANNTASVAVKALLLYTLDAITS